MADPVLYTYLSVALVSLLALVGIASVGLDADRLDSLVVYLVAFAAGTLFGDAFLHIVPETAATWGFGPVAGLYVLAGVVLALVLEKYLAWHHSHHPDETAAPVSYMILVGDGLHNFVDGLIIAASYLASVPLGVATTTAIVFHEIPQELGDFGVLVYGGVPRLRALAYNFLTALTAFVGATVVVVLSESAVGITRELLPFAAGNFLYIAGSDLLPELAAETDPVRSAGQLAAFLAGIGLLYLLAL